MALWFLVILYYIKKYTTISCRKKWQERADTTAICSTADLPVLGLALGWGGGGGGGDSVSGLTTVIDPYIATVSVLYHPFKINPSVGTL